MLRALGITLLVVVVGACGGEGGAGAGGEVTRADLVTALRAGTDQRTAECVADGLLAAELTDDELREFSTFTGDQELPSQIDVYTAVRADC